MEFYSTAYRIKVMNSRYQSILLLPGLLALSAVTTADAGDVKILAADMHKRGDNIWMVNVTLEHEDTGWDHYANNWRVVDEQGNVLGNRILYHPHVNEQPFTRGQNGVKIPEGIETIYIEAHDKVHGWTQNRLKMDLRQVTGGRLRILAE